MNATFVTALYQIYPSEHSQEKRLLDDFGRLLSAGLRLVVFVDDYYETLIGNACREAGAVVIGLSLDGLEIYRRVLESGCALPAVRSEKKDTIEYLALMNGKIEFLLRALPHAETEYLAWIDAGTAKHFRDASSWARLASVRFGGFSTILMPGCNHHVFPFEVLCDRVCWMFLGTMFVCHHAFVRSFYWLSVEALDRFFLADRVVWEINVWIDIVSRCPGVIRWYQADHDDTMTRVPSRFTRPPVCLVSPGRTTASRMYDAVVRPGEPLPGDGWVVVPVAPDAPDIDPGTVLEGDGLVFRRDEVEPEPFGPDLVIDDRVVLVALPVSDATRERIASLTPGLRLPLLPVVRETSCDGLGNVLKCLLNGLGIAGECRVRVNPSYRLGRYDTVLGSVHICDEAVDAAYRVEEIYTCRLLMLREEAVLFPGLPPFPHFHLSPTDGVQNARLNRFFVPDRRIDFCYEPEKIPLPIRERVLDAVGRVVFHDTVLAEVDRVRASLAAHRSVLGVSVRTWTAPHETGIYRPYDFVVYEKTIGRAVEACGATFMLISIDNPEWRLLTPYLDLAARLGIGWLVLGKTPGMNDLQHAAVKMLVLSGCTSFVGSYMSTFTELVYWFSRCRARVFPVVYCTEVYVLYDEEASRTTFDRAWAVPLRCPLSDGAIAVARHLPARHTRWVGFLSSDAPYRICLERVDEALRRIEVEEGFAAGVDVVAFFNPFPGMTLSAQLGHSVPGLPALFRRVLAACGDTEEAIRAFDSPSTVCFYCNYWIARKDWVARFREWLEPVLRFIEDDGEVARRGERDAYYLRERLAPYFFGSRGARVLMV
jgi:hypothetical protein